MMTASLFSGYSCNYRNSSAISRNSNSMINVFVMKDVEYFRFTVRVDGLKGKAEDKILILHLEYLSVNSFVKDILKQEKIIHIFDISAISIQDDVLLSITSNDETFLCGCSLKQDAIDIVCHIAASQQAFFPKISLKSLMKIDVPSYSRLDPVIKERVDNLCNSDVFKSCRFSHKCGAFCLAYRHFCMYYGVPNFDEIEWDIDTLYYALDCSTFKLSDFTVQSKHFGPLLAALAMNDYFTALDCSNVKLTSDHFSQLKLVFRLNCNLSSINFSNCNLRSDFVKMFASELDRNVALNLRHLDISQNAFDDKVCDKLGTVLSRQRRTLLHVNVANSGFTVKGLNKLAESLSDPLSVTPLLELRIDGNCGAPKAEDPSRLQDYLSNNKSLTIFSAGHCDLIIETLITPLRNGCIGSLSYLDLSDNYFFAPLKKSILPYMNKSSYPDAAVSVPILWEEFLVRSTGLRTIKLNRCKLPVVIVTSLLSSINKNTNLTGVHVEVSGNDLGPGAARLIGDIFQELAFDNIAFLDISDNLLDDELGYLISRIHLSNLQQLCLGGNNFNYKSMQETITALTCALTIESCKLSFLSLRGAKLKQFAHVLLGCLGDNTSITKLDIRGTSMGDTGAKILAKSLCLNRTIMEVLVDDNHLTVDGLHDLADCLKHNSTVCRLPIPSNDISRWLESHSYRSDALDKVLSDIQAGLCKNQSRGRCVSSKEFKLRHEFGYGEELDELIHSVESLLSCAPHITDSDNKPMISSVLSETRVALSNAKRSKNIMKKLQAASQELDQLADAPSKLALQRDLPSLLAEAVHNELESYKQKVLDIAMEDIASSESLGEVQQSWASNSQCGVSVINLENLISNSLSLPLSARLSEVKFSLAVSLADSVYETVISSLRKLEENLNEIVKVKERFPTKVSQEVAGTKSKKATSKRQSRPCSVVGKAGGLAVVTTMDLGVLEQTSTALTKNRAKPPQRRPPTKIPAPKALNSEDNITVDPDVYDDLDIDLGPAPVEDDFFQKPNSTEKTTSDSANNAPYRPNIPHGAVPLFPMGGMNISLPKRKPKADTDNPPEPAESDESSTKASIASRLSKMGVSMMPGIVPGKINLSKTVTPVSAAKIPEAPMPRKSLMKNNSSIGDPKPAERSSLGPPPLVPKKPTIRTSVKADHSPSVSSTESKEDDDRASKLPHESSDV